MADAKNEGFRRPLYQEDHTFQNGQAPREQIGPPHPLQRRLPPQRFVLNLVDVNLLSVVDRDSLICQNIHPTIKAFRLRFCIPLRS